MAGSYLSPISKKSEVQYSCGVDDVVKATLKIGENNSGYELLSHNKLAKIIHYKYDKSILLNWQSIYVTVFKIDDNNTKVEIEVVEEREKLIRNGFYQQHIDYMTTEISKELGIILRSK